MFDEFDHPDLRPPLVHDPKANHEYVLTVYDPKDWMALWDELTVDGLGDNHIPQRGIEVMNGRPFNMRSAHFSLTDAEAAEIRLDPRVEAVDLKYELQREKRASPTAIRSGHYSAADAVTSNMRNWGLVASTNTARIYSASIENVVDAYPYLLEGDGIDIIICDTGVSPNHPELAVNADGTGGTRVVDFDWATLGVPGCKTAAEMGGSYLGDAYGHGTYVASIAAGNTCGWAPKAAIYSIRNLVEGGLVAQNLDIAFDLATAFHLAKIAAGNTRPTICSNSWIYDSTWTGIVQTRYRGDFFANTFPMEESGHSLAFGMPGAIAPLRPA